MLFFSKLLLKSIATAIAIYDSYEQTVLNRYPTIFRALPRKLLSKVGYFSNTGSLIVDGKSINYTVKNNGNFEAFKVWSISTSLEIYPGERFCYAVVPKNSIYKQLFYLSCYFNALINLKKKSQDIFNTAFYFRESLDTVNSALLMLRDQRQNTSEVSFAKAFQGRIQHQENCVDEVIQLKYKDCVILRSEIGLYKNNKANQLSKGNKSKKPKRIFVVYLDNISYETCLKPLLYSDQLILRNPIADLFSKYKITASKFTSTSNWTFPAAVSMFSMQPYWVHKIYHPGFRGHHPINSLISRSKENNNYLKEILQEYNSFISGRNWRMNTHHGLNNIFAHSITADSNEIDIYDVVSQSLKQIDIAGQSSSIHWVNIMDTHHPMNSSVLPLGATKYLSSTSLMNSGLSYDTGPKVNCSSEKKSAFSIYQAQIASAANAVDLILQSSLKYIPIEEHLIMFVSDHGSNFPETEDQYASLFEKHTPLFAISSNYLDANIECKDASFAEQRFAHFSLFSCIHKLAGFSDASLHHSCYSENLSKISIIFYPGKPFEFIYFDDEANAIYRYVSKLTAPVNSKVDSRFSLFWLELKEHVAVHNGWSVIRKNADSADLISVDNLPSDVLFSFEEIFSMK
ncbi:hypothetical protein SynBIOSU31_00473 [Synechococcus sp. BIOS-U3-1]|uniref:hypothetical protein n=1 Tax=Synechococcus sp. BIOS-U3-1 TaxID=1400865 RepID=UPI00164905E7|nr:hypothetical protein [Synechococcus sp. BIOS-U3-1]QNI57380.1 hypothetical protein SynBIOSU31_00473 [Synechococcus sp. BIOS-U3-1]